MGGHSLRAGFLTEASRTGATIAKMQEVSRHKKVEVLLGYVRSAELFDDLRENSFFSPTTEFPQMPGLNTQAYLRRRPHSMIVCGRIGAKAKYERYIQEQ